MEKNEGKITFYKIDCPTDSPMTVRMAGTFQAPGVVQAVYSSDNQAIYTLVSDQILIHRHIRTTATNVFAGEVVNGVSLCSRRYIVYGLGSVNGYHFFRTLFAYYTNGSIQHAIAHLSWLIEFTFNLDNHTSKPKTCNNDASAENVSLI
jgi:hypothetical protein